MLRFLYAEMETNAEISNESVPLEVKLADVINCTICCGLLNNAKLLPCGHSYCLKCLECLNNTEQNAGEGVQPTCPQCKKGYAIPSGGLQCLPENVYVDALVQLKDLPASDRPGSGDECSLASDGQVGEAALESVNVPKSASKIVYTAKTSVEGRGAKPSPEPDATPAPTADATADSPRKSKSPRKDSAKMCSEHNDREVTCYCLDCDQPMCETCFIRRHNGHRHAIVDEVVGELRAQLHADAEKLDSLSASDMANLRPLEEQRAAMMANVKASIRSTISLKIYYL